MHIATHRLDTISREALTACRGLLPSGGPIQAMSPFRVEIVGPVFTIWRGREPIVTCGVGRGSDATWLTLVELQTKLAPVPQSTLLAPTKQWLAVAILPPMLSLAKSDIGWLGDFERCMAAAMLIQERKRI